MECITAQKSQKFIAQNNFEAFGQVSEARKIRRSVGKESACNARNWDSIPALGRSTGAGNGNPLQYSCLENPMDRGAWWATIHGLVRVDTTQ